MTVKNIVAVASGKGGVGKSTVSVNLAVTLAKHFRVGLLDADIYGPSLPTMMGIVGWRPVTNDENKMIPLEKHNVKIMSMGSLVEDSSSIVWRGPMLFKALDQLINDVAWGELDYLVIDLPPGTGDVPLSLTQKLNLTGAVIVTTPQSVALADAKKAVDLFERTQVPILGVIENMSYWIDSTGTRRELFPSGHLGEFLASKDLIHLGVLPFDPKVGMSCEIGIPLTAQKPTDENKKIVTEFADICEHIADLLNIERVKTCQSGESCACRAPNAQT